MTTLSTLIEAKNPDPDERNLVTGQVYSYVASAKPQDAVIQDGFCWSAPAAGNVVLEVWGSGAGSATACCCGIGMGGNSGAYAKKCIVVDAGSCICGNVQTGATPGFCNGNCGCPGCVCWQGTAGSNGCIWVGGGRHGLATCSTGTSFYCCMVIAGMCHTNQGSSCGLVCNYNASWELGCVCADCAVDVCRVANISCAEVYCNSGAPRCGVKHYAALAPGLHSTGGATVVWSPAQLTGVGYTSTGWMNVQHALAQLSRFPKGGAPLVNCVSSNWPCGCYRDMCCIPYLPVGMGGTGTSPWADCRGKGKRGGPAAVRITFTPS